MPGKETIKLAYPRIGAHVSGAGDLSAIPLNAAVIGAECFQFFSRPPQGGKARLISNNEAQKFQAGLIKYGLEAYIHTPYFINLASANNRIYYGSINVIREELERGSQLGVKYLMTHLGSAKELGNTAGQKKVIEAIGKILDGYRGSTQFLIEMSAGAGEIIGDTFEEIAKIIDSPQLKKYSIGICFDTAHGFASGYDLRDGRAVKDTFNKFDRIIGLKKLKLIHANDSQADLASHKDRHEHIGKGKIGLAGFKALVAFAKKQKINLVLETPHQAGNQDLLKDIKILKSFR